MEEKEKMGVRTCGKEVTRCNMSGWDSRLTCREKCE